MEALTQRHELLNVGEEHSRFLHRDWSLSKACGSSERNSELLYEPISTTRREKERGTNLEEGSHLLEVALLRLGQFLERVTHRDEVDSSRLGRGGVDSDPLSVDGEDLSPERLEKVGDDWTSERGLTTGWTNCAVGRSRRRGRGRDRQSQHRRRGRAVCRSGRRCGRRRACRVSWDGGPGAGTAQPWRNEKG